MGRQPDYKLGIYNKNSKESNKIGAAWINDNRSISIVLDPYVYIPPYDRNVTLTLWPNEPKATSTSTNKSKTETKKNESYEPYISNDDIPF